MAAPSGSLPKCPCRRSHCSRLGSTAEQSSSMASTWSCSRIPDHFRGFRMFDDIERALTSHLEEFHQDVANLGLRYPLPAMSLVEVPTRLRTYRGGWLLDGEPGLSGVVPLKENGLPMVRPEYRFLVRPNRRSDQVDALEKVIWLFNIASNLDSMAGSGGIMKVSWAVCWQRQRRAEKAQSHSIGFADTSPTN